ncbi:MAG TPA: ferritin family protein, partial [Ideonella sp.]|nr:ferritin family protein [Ideonella sp.]
MTVPMLVGIADAIERESVRRYETLAATMERRGETATAAAFHVMLDEERKHIEAIDRWAASLGRAREGATTFEWRLPADLFSSWDEVAGSARLTPYRAFAIAVDNEQRAFALYSYLAAAAGDPRVATEAERLALEELRHASLMRRWRREAWHRERRAAGEGPYAVSSAVTSPDSLHALLARGEAAVAGRHRAIAMRLREVGDDESAQLLEQLTPTWPVARETGVQPVPSDHDLVHLLVAAQ